MKTPSGLVCLWIAEPLLSRRQPRTTPAAPAMYTDDYVDDYTDNNSCFYHHHIRYLPIYLFNILRPLMLSLGKISDERNGATEFTQTRIRFISKYTGSRGKVTLSLFICPLSVWRAGSVRYWTCRFISVLKHFHELRHILFYLSQVNREFRKFRYGRKVAQDFVIPRRTTMDFVRK